MSGDGNINLDTMTIRLRKLTQGMQVRILLVDDDELERALIADRLELCGFEVNRVADGQEALKALEQQMFPIMITDWKMPVMDGIELTQKLRERGLDDTYIIMLTSRDTNFDYDLAYRIGVDDYLIKKANDTELLSRIYAAFNTYSLRRALKETKAALAAATGRTP